MKPQLSSLCLLLFYNCNLSTEPVPARALLPSPFEAKDVPAGTMHTEGSWKHFLQNLAYEPATVVDYRGNPVPNQEKSWKVIPYDVGKRDLQQCADALMRIRAEYLFASGRHAEIRFQFTSGHSFSFKDYCTGMRPKIQGSSVIFKRSAPACDPLHEALRKYLDIVYTYAGTLSLEKELVRSDSLETGSVIIKGGSPGHCMMIINEKRDENGEQLFMLAEGYTPAQSIYILNNLEEPELGPWHRIIKGQPINTASYTFTRYSIRKFE